MRAGRENPAAARFGDPYAEAAIRHRIVRELPGDPKEIGSYLRLVASLARESDPRVPEMLHVAEWDRRRYQDLLDVAIRIWPSPILERRRRVWDQPLETIAR
jgi:hypothetical protein